MLKITKFTLIAAIILFALSACSHKSFIQNLAVEQSSNPFVTKVDSIVIHRMNAYNITGLAIGLVKDNSIIYTQGYGVSAIKEGKAVALWDETLDYGQKLMQVADRLAKKHNLEHLKTQRIPPEANEMDVASKLHIVYAVAKWLVFYGKNGHGYEADF